MKTCTKCKENKPLTDFGVRNISIDGRRSHCNVCRRKQQKDYALNNPETVKQATKNYRRNNPKKTAVILKAWIDSNNEHLREYAIKNRVKSTSRQKVYAENNKEKLAHKRLLNKDKLAAYNKTYRKTEKGILVSSNSAHKRRVMKLNTLDGTLPLNTSINTAELRELLKIQNHKCGYCNIDLNLSMKRTVHLDHIIPLSKGGGHTICNVVWSCANCNLRKGNRLL